MISSAQDFKDKKVLLFGLGILGGGIATANWLTEHGACLTISDIKTDDQLASALRQLNGSPILHLGAQMTEDIDDNEIIVVNPAVSFRHPLIQYAQTQGKQVLNEATIFYQLCAKPLIGVTGTRGKTTTAHWTAHFLKTQFPAIASGNSTSEPFLKTLEQQDNYQYIVTELPSFALEFFDEHTPAPEIAVITNISSDHLNRYTSFEDYVSVKAHIFKTQTADQSLILNYDNQWTDFLLEQKPKSHVSFFSLHRLPADINGVWHDEANIYYQEQGISQQVLAVGAFVENWGVHNLENLLASVAVAHRAGIAWTKIQAALASLPQVPFRQQIVYQDDRLTIINDTTATSPDGSLAAIRRFHDVHAVFIIGGTDASLDYTHWAQEVVKLVTRDQLIFLSGSATDSMLRSLAWTKDSVLSFDTLQACFEEAISHTQSYPSSVIIFSPGAKSFEKFNNEFDRGEQFNQLVADKFARNGGVA